MKDKDYLEEEEENMEKGKPKYVSIAGSPSWNPEKNDQVREFAEKQKVDWQDQSPFGENSRGRAEDLEGQREKRQKSPRKKKGKRVLSLILVVILSVGAGFAGGYFSPLANNGSSGGNITINSDSNITTTEAVAEKALPSVVGITSTKTNVSNDSMFGSQETETEGVGTGIIVDSSGFILTNSHVVMDGSLDKMIVLLADGREVDGEVIWNNESLDLAIVQIKAGNLQAAELGDSDDVNIGSYAAAIGNPLGLQFASSVTQGVVSGLNRAIVASDGNTQTKMEGLMQVDAAINSGNSGGPLLNSEGQVIGINTAKATGEGMGFAIPINIAKPIVDRVKETGDFSSAYMGVNVIDVSDLLEQYPYLDLGVKTGAYVDTVAENSPAAEAGIVAKDIIVGLDDTEIDSSKELINTLLQYEAGDKVSIKLVRDGTEKTLSVKLDEN